MKISIGMPPDLPEKYLIGSEDDHKVALHEAGHAVIATMLGMEVRACHIGNDHHGGTDIYLDFPIDDHRWKIIGCAGPYQKVLIGLGKKILLSPAQSRKIYLHYSKKQKF